MKRTLFSFEVPLPHLEDFDDLQDFYFSLSFLHADPRYHGFMQLQATGGLKSVWLDNSYNEKMQADDTDLLQHLNNQLYFTKVIAPDSPQMTPEEILEGFRQVAAFRDEDSTIAVVSSLEMSDFMLQYGATHQAISYWTRPNIDPDELRRMTVHPIYTHFLGLLNPDEIKAYRPHSCDTSMPIKIAMLGMTHAEWVEKGCEHINTKDLGPSGKGFFTATLTPEQIDLARKNIISLKEECNG